MSKQKKAFIFSSLAIIFPILVEKFIFYNEAFSFDRFLLLFLVLIFAFSFLVFDRKKELEFIYKKRYILGICLFAFLVIMGYHGSSISIYNQIIEPEYNIESSKPILGQERVIRGDEWGVSTPTLLSQVYNDFNEKSSILMATDNNVTLYPKIVARTLSAISIPNQLGFLFLPTEQAFSFSWFFGYFLLFFASFELLMIITQKNKFYSLLGSLLITFSPAVQWWEFWNVLAYGEIAMILFNFYLKEKNKVKEILYSIGIGIIGACYIMCLYPAWQVPYGFLFLLLAIWIMKQNKEDCNLKKMLLLITVTIAVICAIIIPIFLNSYDIYLTITNTAYPGKRFMTGGDGWQNLFNYFSSIFNTYKESSNASEMAQFISLYPVPIIIGLYYWHQNRKKYKKDFLLVALTCLAILLTVWNYVELPEFLAKISLLSFSTPNRCSLVASFVCLLLLIVCLSRYSEKNIKYTVKFQNFIIAFLLVWLGIYVVKVHYPDYIDNSIIIIDLLLYVPVIFLVLINHTKLNKIAFLVLTLATVFSGIGVHPLNKGLDVVYEKPIAKEVQKINENDKDATWATVETVPYVQNYLVANGAHTLNSTNFYPNLKMWDKLDLPSELENIYNRYSHININITNSKTTVSLKYEDQLNLELNSSDVCLLGIDYLVTEDELNSYDNNQVTFNNIYDKYSMKIYSVRCNS